MGVVYLHKKCAKNSLSEKSILLQLLNICLWGYLLFQFPLYI